jgi:hypothetical protein
MIKGIPASLPEGERVLWQGNPAWRVLIGSVFHVRFVASYFALIILWCTASSWQAGTPAVGMAISVARMAGAALVPLGLMTLYTWQTQRTTVYTITNRRVVMHFGVAFPMSFNIPFAMVTSAAVSMSGDGSGDIALQLQPGSKLAYLAMWPLVRPWRMARAEPMLRGIADVAPAAQILSRALAAYASVAVPAGVVAPRAAGATIGAEAPAAA